MSLKPEEVAEEKAAESGEIKPKKMVFTEELDETPATPTSASTTDSSQGDAERLAGFLNYFVTPSYLRKSVFGDLKPYESAKKMPKLPNTPFLSHKASPNGQYLVGLGVASKVDKKKSKSKSSSKKKNKKDETSFVNIGGAEYLELSNKVKVPVNARVVVDVQNKTLVSAAEVFKLSAGESIETEEPSWTTSTESLGYTVRIASTFGQIFTESPFPSGYKFTACVPCSEFSVSASTKSAADAALASISLITDDSLLKKGISAADDDNDSDPVPILLVFGKWKELAASIQADVENFKDLKAPELVFDGRVRVSRATRVEDAAMIALAKIEGI